MTKNWTIALLLLTVICCLWFIPDKPYDTHTTEHSIVEADNKAIIKQRDSGLKIIDSLQKGIVKRDTLIGELKSKLSFIRRDLDKSTAKAVQLANEIKQLKGRDTTELGRKADSLASVALEYAWLYNQYKASSDSLAAVVDKNSEDYVKALEERRRMYDDLYSKYEQLYRLYNALYADHQQAGKKLRRQKLKTKVAALLGLIGAGVIIMK